MIEMTANDEKQSHEPSVRSQRAKVARNKKAVGETGGELFLDKTRYWHI